MSLKHIWAVTLKELRHIRRDWMTLFLVTLTPTALLFLMAYAVTVEIRHVPIAVLDYDRSPTSRAFIQQITVSDDLELYQQVSSMDEIEDLLLRSEIKAAVVIPPAFESELLAMSGIPLQVIVDGTEPQSGGFAVDRIGARTEQFASELLAEQLRARGIQLESLQALDLRVRTWYNPNLEAKVDLVPGLISMVLGLPGMSVALTLAREREHGTLEQLLATPIGRAELLVGKMLPYVISGLVNLLLTTAAAMLWFGVPFRGNFLLYVVLSTAYFLAILSIGMLIGVFTRTQAASMALSFLVIFFPGFFLTGIFFPITSMPPIVRMEAMILPGTHYAIITRGIYTIGVGLDVLWPNGLAMVGLGIAFTAVAALFFKKKLG